MSLINQMLKDLQQRRAGVQAVVSPAEQSNVQTELQPVVLIHNRSWRKVLLPVLVLIAVIGAAVLLWPKSASKAVNRVTMPAAISTGASQSAALALASVPAASVSTIPVSAPASAPAITSVLKDVTYTQSPGQGVLIITMSEPVEYQMNVDDHSPRNINIEIPGKFLPRTLPNFTADSLLEKLVNRYDGHNIIFTLTLSSQAILKSIDVNPQDNTQLWVTLTQQATVMSPQPPATNVPAIAKEIPLTEDQKAEQAYQAILAEYQAGNNSEAVNDLQALIKQFPNYLPARIALGKYYIQQQQYPQAQAVIAAGLQQAPGSPDLTMLQARLAYTQGNVRQALQIMQSEAPTLQFAPEYYAFKAALLQQTGDAKDASDLYQQLVNLDGSRSDWWLGYALSLQAQGYTNAAVNAYRHVLNDANISPDVRVFVVNKLRQLGG